MTLPRRYHTRQQKTRRRRLQKERERLQREQARAQRALQALEEALQELGLPESVAEEVQWRLQAQQRLVGKIFGMMFPPFLAAGPITNCAGYGAGTSTCPAAFWGPCRSGSGSNACSGWAKSCWCACGGVWKRKARPPAVGGSGPGSGMIAS